MFSQSEYFNLNNNPSFTRRLYNSLYLIGHDWKNCFIKGDYAFCFNLTTYIFTDEFIKENNL